MIRKAKVADIGHIFEKLEPVSGFEQSTLEIFSSFPDDYGIRLAQNSAMKCCPVGEEKIPTYLMLTQPEVQVGPSDEGWTPVDDGESNQIKKYLDTKGMRIASFRETLLAVRRLMPVGLWRIGCCLENPSWERPAAAWAWPYLQSLKMEKTFTMGGLILSTSSGTGKKLGRDSTSIVDCLPEEESTFVFSISISNPTPASRHYEPIAVTMQHDTHIGACFCVKI